MKPTPMVPRIAAVAALLLLPCSTPAQQQDTSTTRRPGDAIPFAPYARPTHMWASWPAGAMYEADINIPLHLYSRTFDLQNPDSTAGANPRDCLRIPLANYISLGDTKIVTGCTLTFVPHFIIRQLEGGSAPVQTPTFNPGFEFNWHRLAIRPELEGGMRHGVLRTLHFRYAHYSNGQSGCLGATQEQQDDGSCRGEFGRGTPLNIVDGSFSTNYLEVGVTRTWVTYANGAERFVHGPSIAGRVHVPVPPGQMSWELSKVYGRGSALAGYLVRGRGQLMGVRTTTALVAEAEYGFGRAPGYEPWRGTATASISFPGAYGLGLSAKYSAGFDYYNVAFGRTHSSFAGGIMFDHTRGMAITRAAQDAIARAVR